jgi:hypothetical protein
VKQDHPGVVPIRQPNHGLNDALKPGKPLKQAGAITPPDPEAKDITGETAEPADHDERTETERARMRRITRKQRQQQAMPGRIGKHQTVGHIAVLANEVEERGQVRRKQQSRPTLNSTSAGMSGFGPDASSMEKPEKETRRASACFKSTDTWTICRAVTSAT